MTITICSFSSSDSSSSGSADTDDSELQAIWQNVSRNNCTLWTVFIKYINVVFCVINSRWVQ